MEKKTSKMRTSWSSELIWEWDKSTFDHPQWIPCAFGYQIEL